MVRKIIHIDIEAFYTLVELRDHPEFRDKPLAVDYFGESGIVVAESYEAWRYGIRSVVPSKTELKHCRG